MRDFLEKIKPYADNLFLVMVIMLVGLIGFGLGRLSSKYQTAELKIQSTLVNTADLSKIATTPASGSTASVEATTLLKSQNGAVAEEIINQKIVGNKNSKIYHYENCPGALRMSEGNKIFFASIIDAQNAGFKPAGNCPGLK
ncbi:MAG: hypothetical protein HYT38_00590 [Candidatus Sungbacteria bacterium]|uniref:Ada DNA repair metal-binding domain-containing protein n=1 Tax=Candidatus Sungiibacteriota bacterium TaxID=2750080 RepID=A0A9D6DNM8_9BACT|nr:hypothetical protein [Candidatus Sungbacteria bacterium]